MIIKEIQVKNFGQFSGRKIVLKEGINLIYGPNESGKTTLYHVIGALLFGMDKKRGRAAKNDRYQTYQPWEQKTWYEAAMKFETGGKQFFLERNFYHGEKSARLICETDGEELSVSQGDLKVLLGETEEALFFNTAAAGQLCMKPQEVVYNYLQNYISSLAEAGSQSVDVVRALEILEKKKKVLEQEQKQHIAEVRQKLHALETKIELIRAEMETSRLAKEELEAKREQIAFEKEDSKKSLWSRLIGWIKRIFCRRKIGEEEKNAREKMIKTEERILFFKELLGEKECFLEELLQEQEACYEKMHRQSKEDEIKAIAFAMERIQTVSAVHREEVLEKLFTKASAVLETITNGKYRKLLLDERQEPKVWDGVHMLNVFQVSAGCADQIYLSLRIALQELLFREETMPLMFDDGFVYFDDERLGRFLKHLGTLERQVLIFSCQEREGRLMEKLGINYYRENL